MDQFILKERPTDRVALACIQCRSRHVKCDSSQPQCDRCRRDGKACEYQKSRRGGLDKAALARRRSMLQTQAERERTHQADKSSKSQSIYNCSRSEEQISLADCSIADRLITASAVCDSLTFTVNTDRLLKLYYENFHRATPIALPLRYLNVRKMRSDHGIDVLLQVLHWIGSLYSPLVQSDPYYKTACHEFNHSALPETPFTVQAMLLFAIAQHYSGFKLESRRILDKAISIALDLNMNKQNFAKQYGEGDPVLEESWRRTFYFLHLTDIHFAVVVSNPVHTMQNVSNEVDLPCDDEFYESGSIPPTKTWHEYENREIAEVEVIYSSLVYLYDVSKIVHYLMQSYIETGTFGDSQISSVDTKLAIWHSLLPSGKTHPLRGDGTLDELMFLAHMHWTVMVINVHRPFSALTYSLEELSTKSFVTPVPFVESLGQSKGPHTARALKGIDTQTKLLAIPCSLEHHHVFSLCIVASTAAAQLSACNVFLKDHALSIARDRIRLSIGYLKALGTIWPLATNMAEDVKRLARKTLFSEQGTSIITMDSTAESEVPREDMMWPIDRSTAQIDIYSAIVLPMDFDMSPSQYSSSTVMS